MTELLNTINSFIAFLIKVHVLIYVFLAILALWLLVSIIRRLK